MARRTMHFEMTGSSDQLRRALKPSRVRRLFRWFGF